MSRFIVMTSSAHVSASRRKYNHAYRNVAVVEIDLAEGEEPKMISERAKGVLRIVRNWPAQYVGKTMNCEYQKALAYANVLADKLNAGETVDA